MTKTRDLADLGGGFIQAGTGAVQRTVESKLQDVVSVKDFGAVGDGVADDTAAIQAALNAAATSKATLLIPAGYYLVTSALTLPSYAPHAGRGCSVRVVGQGYYTSVIKFTAADYLLTSTGADYITFSGIQVDTTTGGFLKTTGQCGGLHIDHFFMNGCGANYYFLETGTGSTDLYTANITDSRFWRETGYQGGVIWMRDSGINLALRNSFISQMRRNGGIVRIGNCDGFLADNCQFEGAEATTTSQSMIELDGFNFNVTVSNCYFEGKWDYGVRVIGGATRGLRLIANKAWEYAGKPSPVVLDVSGGTVSGAVVDGLSYINNDTGAGTGHIINDPSNVVDIANVFNNSTGNQAARSWSQNVAKEFARGSTGLGFVALGNTFSYQVQLPTLEGEYEFAVTFYTQDQNHATNARYRVIYDAGHSFNFATTDIIGTIKTKGTVPPTGLTCTVTTGGLITASATAAQSGSPSVYWYWQRLSDGI